MSITELILEANNEVIKWNELICLIDNNNSDKKIHGKKWSIKDIIGHVVFWNNFAIETVESRLKGIDISSRLKISDQYEVVNQKVWEKIQSQKYPIIRNELTRSLEYLLEFLHKHETEFIEEDIELLMDSIYHQRHHRASIKSVLRALG